MVIILSLKELAMEFEGQFGCLWENTENVSIEKEVTKVYKEGNENITIISYKIKLVHSAKFMASSL